MEKVWNLGPQEDLIKNMNSKVLMDFVKKVKSTGHTRVIVVP